MKKFQFIYLLLFVATLAACSKKDNDAPAPTKTDLLAGHAWKLTGLLDDGVDGFANYNDCQKDNIYHFNKDGTLVSDNGTVHCTPDEPAVTNIFWNLSPDETSLTTRNTADAPGITYIIAKLTDQTLDLHLGSGNNSSDQIFTAQ